jgi:hypothetical protein
VEFIACDAPSIDSSTKDAPPIQQLSHSLSGRIAYVLSAAREAGFDGLEDVLTKLYTTNFTIDKPSELACKDEQSIGWGRRIETLLDSTMESGGSDTWRASDSKLQFKRAIIKATVVFRLPLFSLPGHLLQEHVWNSMLEFGVSHDTPCLDILFVCCCQLSIEVV